MSTRANRSKLLFHLEKCKKIEMSDVVIVDLDVKDIRFPTSMNSDGSDAMHTDPDYSCAYIITTTNTGLKGYGLTFTLGKGTEIVTQACKSMFYLIRDQKIDDIFSDFAKFWRKLTSQSQIRWIGPEKGAVHLAVAAIINSLWDLWARKEGKPLWKLLTDMSPEQLVSTIDFRYITDVITKEEAIDLLKKKSIDKTKREKLVQKIGYPAYTTQVGWLGYKNEKIRSLCEEYLKRGFMAFKIKVGQDLENDIERCRIVREVIGENNYLMVDANQVWDVQEAIDWMKSLAEFKPLWIEEPTSPDDILGHKKIAESLKPFGIGVATGEMCANRVMFKQMLQANALEYCQIDSARVGGVNEILSIYLMAEKCKVPVCPHAGGVGLCEMVQHLQMWDYICLSGTTQKRMIEYVDQQHEHFEDPATVNGSFYKCPEMPGYSTKIKDETINKFCYPEGTFWKNV